MVYDIDDIITIQREEEGMYLEIEREEMRKDMQREQHEADKEEREDYYAECEMHPSEG